MAHICVNGISSKSAGGKSILTNFLRVLKNVGSIHKFTIIIPENSDYSEFLNISENVVLIAFPVASKQWLLPFTNAYLLPRFLDKEGCDIVFNLSDLPIPTRLPQLFLFDWSYAAFPDSIAWKLGGIRDRLTRKLKLYIFKKNFLYIDVVIAQGEALRQRLMRLYDIANVPVVPNAVSLDNLTSNRIVDFGLTKGYKLLCLSRYYSHKNIEIFLDLGDLISKNKLDWKIIVTIDQSHSEGAKLFLEMVKKRGLDQIILNVGSVDMGDVPSLYQQCDALLLPTLLESFSGTYIEAMYHCKPIYTSNYEFAHDVCKNSAWYFDPLDANSIFDCINYAIANQDLRLEKILIGSEILNAMPDWNQAYRSYITIIESMLIGNRLCK
jgi:glycosyltransferase involved in cell wall biosynthesis